jgi:6-phosphogluconolactonase/glucosamine-6-phosphate isomerase/deaminase
MRLQARLQRKNDRLQKRKSRRAESKERRKSRKKERQERAKKVVGTIPVTAIGKTATKVGKQAAEKAKGLSKRLGGKLKRKKKSFGFVDEYYFCFDHNQSCKNFSNDNEDFAFNGMNF